MPKIAWGRNVSVLANCCPKLYVLPSLEEKFEVKASLCLVQGKSYLTRLLKRMKVNKNTRMKNIGDFCSLP